MLGTGLWTPDNRVKPDGGVELDWGHPLCRALRSCWLLSEQGGNVARDLCGRNNLTVLSGVPWVPGRQGPALSFDAVDAHHLQGAPVTAVASLNNYSIEAWFRTTAASASDLCIYAEGNTGTNIPIVLLRSSMPAGGAAFQHRDDADSSNTFVQTGGVVNDGLLHQVVATRNGATFLIYLDGLLSGSLTMSPSPGTTTVNTLNVGQLVRAGNYHPFSGVVELVRTYSDTLQAQEVAQLYSEPYAMLAQSAVRRFYSIAGGAGGIGGVPAWWADTSNPYPQRYEVVDYL